MVELPNVTKHILQSKKEKGLSFQELAREVGRDEVWVTSLIYRQASASREEAERLAAKLELREDVIQELTECPCKGLGPVVPTDPLVYRIYEIMQVYGMPLKSIIHEKFGDGIMSAIDFHMHVEREEDPKGDRVKITMSGKFLPYQKW